MSRESAAPSASPDLPQFEQYLFAAVLDYFSKEILDFTTVIVRHRVRCDRDVIAWVLTCSGTMWLGFLDVFPFSSVAR